MSFFRIIYLKLTIATIVIRILYHLTSNAVYNNLALIINGNALPLDTMLRGNWAVLLMPCSSSIFVVLA
jgi:hypothetical protein